MPAWIARRTTEALGRVVFALAASTLAMLTSLVPTATAAGPAGSLVASPTVTRAVTGSVTPTRAVTGSVTRAVTTAVSAGVQGALPAQNRAYPSCSAANFNAYHLSVPGASTPGVTVYNYSCFSSAPGSNLNTLIYRADEGLVSRTPETTNNPGLMANGDLVVVTAYTIFWISIHSSLGVSGGRSYSGSGLIAGEWPIAPSASGSNQPVFADIVGAGHWAPNWLLPGSAGHGISAMVNGLGVRVVPDCGTDASSVGGVGTFVVQGTPDQSSFKVPPPPATDPHEHLIQFSGVLEQEYTNNGNTIMSDCDGHRTRMAFVLTYRFFDALDPTAAYGGVTAENRLNRVEVAITPLDSNIVVRDFGIGDDLQTEGGGLSLPQTMSDTTEALQRYAAPGDRCNFGDASFPAGARGTVCNEPPSSGQPITEIQESASLQAQDNPPTRGLAAGNIAAFSSADGTYALSYLHPPGYNTRLPPLRDSMVWNTSLGGVSAVETQWIGETDNPVTLSKGVPIDVGQDQDLGQDLNPPRPARLVVSPTILPAAGGTLTVAASTLAGFAVTSDPALDVVTGTSSHHTVTIPPNNTGAPISYTFNLEPRGATTPDAPQPVKVTQAAAPVAVFTAQPGALPAAPLQLNGTPSFENGGTISSYLWHFGDGGTAGGATVEHVFPGPGTYAVILTVTDSRGQKATSADLVHVTRAGHVQRHVRRPGRMAASP